MADLPDTAHEACIVAVGECMLELGREGDHWQLRHSGDTFNTSLYLARLGEQVAFLTALGNDPFSDAMQDTWHAEGLDTSLVLRAPGRLPGLYAICNDLAGERSFYYWRDQAAVRDLFALPGCPEALARVSAAKIFYLSGITLALFDAPGRGDLAACARAVRASGGDVILDPNYRAQLWTSPEAARAAIDTFAPFVTVALPTFEDERVLHGDRRPSDTLARWRDAGANEVVVKLGSAGCMLTNGQTVPPAASLTAIDTTGAGDAFNAGYLAARRRGLEIASAAAFANQLAGRVIGYRGAIIPRSAMLDLAAHVHVWQRQSTDGK